MKMDVGERPCRLRSGPNACRAILNPNAAGDTPVRNVLLVEGERPREPCSLVHADRLGLRTAVRLGCQISRFACQQSNRRVIPAINPAYMGVFGWRGLEDGGGGGWSFDGAQDWAVGRLDGGR
jgi:hypothetical protein